MAICAGKLDGEPVTMRVFEPSCAAASAIIRAVSIRQHTVRNDK